MRNLLGYILYGLAVTAFLLYYRFPSDMAASYLEAAIAGIDPGYAVEVEAIKPWPPATVRIGSIEFSRAGDAAIQLLRAERIRLTPDLMALLRGKVAVDFSLALFDGSLTGSLQFDRENPGLLQAAVELRDIELGQGTLLRELTGRAVQGRLSGTINYSGEPATLLTGSGAMDLHLSEGRLDLTQSLLGLEAVDLREVRVAAELNKGVLQLSTFEHMGREARSSATGTVRLQKNLLDSRLALRGTLEPAPDFLAENPEFGQALNLFRQQMKQGRLAFDISGTVGVPRWKIL